MTVVAPSVAICKNSPKSSEICWLSFKKTCKEMFTNIDTELSFAMVPSTSSMEFGLVEESSLVRRKLLLVARNRWQSSRMATTEQLSHNLSREKIRVLQYFFPGVCRIAINVCCYILLHLAYIFIWVFHFDLLMHFSLKNSVQLAVR